MAFALAPTYIPEESAAAASSVGTGAVDDLVDALGMIDAALIAVPVEASRYAGLSDAQLVAALTAVGRDRDRLGAISATLAGEIARRSATEFGSDGLAQRNGFRTPIEMVKIITRTTARDAVTAVRAGTLLVEAATAGSAHPVTGEIIEPTERWMSPVAVAVAAGELPLAAVDAIRAGLGTPDSVVTVELLTTAAEQLVAVAGSMDPDRLRQLARAARDQIDAAGIGVRAEERRAARSLRLIALPDGMGRLIWTLDPESFATVKTLYDRATSPRRGGVRFGNGEAQAKRNQILADTRTVEQLASDAFTHLLTAGSDADPSVLIGTGAPIVKLITTLDGLRASREGTANGFGYLEGQSDPITSGSIEHAVCIGITEVTEFDATGQPVEAIGSLTESTGPLDEDREHRLFTRKQKSQLALRDGGCRWPDCARPPSWTEAHHIRWWAKDHGPTTIENGVLLCKHHHLLLHNTGWNIERQPDGHGVDRYWLIPPADLDPERTPRAMPTKAPTWRGLVGPGGELPGGRREEMIEP